MTITEFNQSAQTWWSDLSDSERQALCNIHLIREVNTVFTGQITDGDIRMMYALEQNIDPAEIMSDHTPEIPPRPDNWKMDYSNVSNVTTYLGEKHSRLEIDRRNLAEKWEEFKQSFHNQPGRELRGGGNSFTPNLEQIEWNELNPK